MMEIGEKVLHSTFQNEKVKNSKLRTQENKSKKVKNFKVKETQKLKISKDEVSEPSSPISSKFQIPTTSLKTEVEDTN